MIVGTLTSRCLGVLAAAALASVAGCGTAHYPGASAGPPDRSASRSFAPAPASAGPTAGHPGVSAGAVPAGFAATSVTWVSPDEAFVLGTAPCADAPCTSIARTLNRGASRTALPAPAVPVGSPGEAGRCGVTT
jgi:hypothetical protein